MAGGLYRYTDPVMDFLFPPEGEEEHLFWKLARVAYLPILFTLGWHWCVLSGFALDKQLAGWSSVNLSAIVLEELFLYTNLRIDGAQLLWILLTLSVLSGWLLFRTTSGPMEGFKEVLVMGNLLGTGLLLLIGLVNMIQIVLIAMGSFYVGAMLGLCWLIVAGFLLATILWSH